MASIEVASRIVGGDNEVTVRWAPAHHDALVMRGRTGSPRPRLGGVHPEDTVPDEYRRETSMSHDKSSHRGLQSIGGRVDARPIREPGKNVPTPSGEGPMAQAPPQDAEVSREQVLLAPDRPCGDRPLPEEQDLKTVDDRCWWCGGGKQQTSFHLFTECKSIEAVLEVLRDTRIGCINTRQALPEGMLGEEMSDSSGEGEEGPAPQACSFVRRSGEKEKGAPYYDR